MASFDAASIISSLPTEWQGTVRKSAGDTDAVSVGLPPELTDQIKGEIGYGREVSGVLMITTVDADRLGIVENQPFVLDGEKYIAIAARSAGGLIQRITYGKAR